jgi:hypothetical protein
MKPIKVIFIIALVLLCATFVGMNTGKVRAASSQQINIWSFGDSFENYDSAGVWVTDRWECWAAPTTYPNGCSWVFSGTGANYASLGVKSGLSTIGRPVTLSAFKSGRTLRCIARMYVRPYSNTPPSGQLEVIDASTWNYISVKTFTLGTGTGQPWASITTPQWTPPHKDVYVRMVLYGDGQNTKSIDVDALGISCNW